MPGKKYCVLHTAVNAGPTTWSAGEIVEESDLKAQNVDIKRLMTVGAVRVATRDDLANAKARADAAAALSEAAPGTPAPATAPEEEAEEEGENGGA